MFPYRNLNLYSRTPFLFLALFLLLGQTVSVGSQNAPGWGDFSSSAWDDGLPGFPRNPASLAWNRGLGLGFRSSVQTDLFQNASWMDSAAWWLRLGSLSYENRGTTTGRERWSLGLPMGQNAALGYSQVRNSWEGEADYHQLGLVARPLNLLSLGAVGRIPGSQSGGHLDLGLALRPLASTALPDNFLTLWADFTTDFETARFSAAGATLEPLPGLQVRGAWDPINSRIQASLGLRLGAVHSSYEGQWQNDELNQAASLSLHLGSGRPGILDTPLPGRSLRVENPLTPMVLDPEMGTADDSSTYSHLQGWQRLRDDSRVSSVTITRPFLFQSMAHFWEIQEAMAAFVAAGKTLHFHLDNYDLWNYALAASLGAEISVAPQGFLAIQGLNSGRIYWRNLLDEWGIEIVSGRNEEYKSALDSLTRSDMSEAERENLESLLGVVVTQLQEWIDQGRGEQLALSAREVLGAGPYWNPEAALDQGLVDHVEYVEDFRERLEQNLESRLVDIQTIQGPEEDSWGFLPRLAVVHISGGISPGDPQDGTGIYRWTRLLDQALDNPLVRGIVLRINSGGGAVQASDFLAREIQRVQEAAREQGKPLVVSMGSVAASGAYWISAPVETLVASPFTLTGSIGVFGTMPNLSGLLERFDLNYDQVQTHGSTLPLNPFVPVEGRNREALQSVTDYYYGRFLDHVASNREMDRDRVREVARGRVWTGEQARERSLTDENGGLQRALDLVATELGLPANSYEVLELSPPQPFSLRRALRGMLLNPQEQSFLEEVQSLGSVLEGSQTPRIQAEAPPWVTEEWPLQQP